MRRQTTTASFRIRAGKAQDAPAIARMANRLGLQSGGTGKTMTAALLRKMIGSPSIGMKFLVAEAGGKCVGYAMHGPAFETAYAASGRYLSDLYVEKVWRRRGVGRALVRAVALRASRHGGTFLWWVWNGKDPAAEALYRSLADIREPVTAFAVTRQAFGRLVK